MKQRISFILSLCVALPISAIASDWSTWLGPNGDSTWTEPGIVERIPDSGLKTIWTVPVSLGYSAPSVANGRVYVLDYEKASGEITNRASWKDELEGKERVLCFSEENGELLWKYEYDRSYRLSYGSGPRCMPIVAEGRVYALGAEGDLSCLNAETGTLIWKKSYVDEYNAETPIWGVAAHPLVHNGLVYCVIGGEGSLAVAFDSETGEERWRALTAPEAGYCPATIINHGGTEQLIVWHPEAINSLDPQSGELHWSHSLRPSYSMSVIAPRLSGDRLFLSGQGNVGVMLELDPTKPAMNVLWKAGRGIAAYNATSTPFFLDDVVFSCDIDTSALIAFSATDGTRMWQTIAPTIGLGEKARHGTAFLVRNTPSGLFYIMSETGDLIIAKLSAEGYEEIGRTHINEPTNNAYGRSLVWSHPAFANKSIFVRNDKVLARVDLSAESY